MLTVCGARSPPYSPCCLIWSLLAPDPLLASPALLCVCGFLCIPGHRYVPWEDELGTGGGGREIRGLSISPLLCLGAESRLLQLLGEKPLGLHPGLGDLSLVSPASWGWGGVVAFCSYDFLGCLNVSCLAFK